MTQSVKSLPAVGVTWVGEIPWIRKWQPTPEFLPGEFHGERSLVGYSLWGHKESDATEPLTFTLRLFVFKFCMCWAAAAVLLSVFCVFPSFLVTVPSLPSCGYFHSL